MAIDVLGLLYLRETWSGFMSFFPRFIAGILIFAAFYALYQGTVFLLRSALERRKAHASIINLTVKTYKYILVVVGFILALQQMGVQFGPALTGLGIVGVALGFAAKDSVSNYISGITIFWDKPFYVGDYIQVNGLYGRVTEITMRSTRIRTLQNQYLIVPNQTIVNELVVNHSKNGEVRVEIPFAISYEDTISRARAVVLGLVDPERDQRLSQYLRPTVVVNRLGDNGVECLLRVWVNKAEDEVAVSQEYAERAKEVLAAHGITIPYPQRTLHLPETWPRKQETLPSESSH